MLYMLQEQGLIFALLILLSSITLAIVIERLLFLRPTRLFPLSLECNLSALESGKKLLLPEEPETKTSLARKFLEFFEKYSDTSQEIFDRKLTSFLTKTQFDLEKYLPVLGTMGSVTPFLGLLGTVIGIIIAFRAMAVTGEGGLTIVASGVSIALVTTAAGLFIAIPAVVSYNYLNVRVEKILTRLETMAWDFYITRQKVPKL